jgi:asparagine synthase (glutamine-hydrolysing)
MIGDCTVVFNGEIYNYIELRKELEKKGIRFRTESGTEVLLQSYLVYGQKCVDKIEGMWSFAIYDKGKGTLFLSRDRFAEKPLYFLQTSDGYYFGSEIKFIRTLLGSVLSVNFQHLYRYLVNGYKSLYKTRETFFDRIQEVPFASNLIIDSDLSCCFKKYWTPVSNLKEMSLQEAIEGFRHHLLESVKIRLRADVPLAFCLSGGIDSAAIVSIATKCHNYDVSTFSIIDNDERYNELENIQATIDDLGCKHTLINTSSDGFFERLKRLVEYHDGPLSTITYYIHSFLSEEISKHGYRVVCSGTAADELVTGYYDHFNLYLYEMRNHKDYEKCLRDWKEGMGKFVRNPHLKNPQLYFENPDFRKHIYLNNDIFRQFLKVDFNEYFFEETYTNSLLRNRMLNELFYESIPVVLHEDDLNSMMHSIENRSPYLDSELFDFAYSIPTEHLIHDGCAKFILREAVKDILNEKVRTDRRKVGFNASINSLIDFRKNENKDYLLGYNKIFEFVNRDKIEKLIQQEGPLENSYSKFLFNFLNIKIFLDMSKEPVL